MYELQNLAEDISTSSTKYIFGIPGSGASLVLLDLLEKKGVEFIRTHIEATAPLMAAAGWQVASQTSIALSIRGPGLANMLPGISACFLERFPVVTFSESLDFSAPNSIAHKRLNHDILLNAISKSSYYLSDNISFGDILKHARTEFPGPVHINLSHGYSKSHIIASENNTNLELDSDTINILKKASRPVVIAGTFASRNKWSPFLNSLKIPVFSTAAAKGTVNEYLPHSAGVYTGVGLELSTEFSLLDQADFIIGLGLVHNEVLKTKEFKCPSVNIAPFDTSEYCSGFSFGKILSTSCFETIFSILREKDWGMDEIMRLTEKLRAKLFSGAFMPPHVFSAVERCFKNSFRTVLDTGNFCTAGEHLCKISNSELYLSSGQGRYMGIGIPLGIGAAIHDQIYPTVVYVGDGSIGMFISELKTAAAMKLPLCVILMRDSFFGSIRPTAFLKNLTQSPLEIKHSSWIATIESFGIPSFEVNKEDSISGILSEWKPCNGPLYIEAVFNPDKYMNFTEGLR